MGWFTVFMYVLAAVLCAVCAMRPVPEKKLKWFWFFLAVSCALLAVNKQLDLQSFFTGIGRCAAKRGGWYDERYKFQLGFIIVLFVLSLGMSGAGFLWIRDIFTKIYLAFFGFCLLLLFVFVRAVSFTKVDQLLRSGPFDFRMNWVLEIGALCLIVAGALAFMAHHRRH